MTKVTEKSLVSESVDSSFKIRLLMHLNNMTRLVWVSGSQPLGCSPFRGRITLSQRSCDLRLQIFVCITVHNSCKIKFWGWGYDNMRSCIKGQSIRKIENPWFTEIMSMVCAAGSVGTLTLFMNLHLRL